MKRRDEDAPAQAKGGWGREQGFSRRRIELRRTPGSVLFAARLLPARVGSPSVLCEEPWSGA